MMADSALEAVQCPYCGVISSRTQSVCPGCGATLQSTGGGTQLNSALEELIDNSHEELVRSGTRASETAFGISCTLGILASGVIVAIVFLAISKAWTVLAIAVLITGLVSVAISSLLASRARSATLRTTYERQVRPDVGRYLKSNGLKQQDLANSAAGRLPEDSPLLAFLFNVDDPIDVSRGDQ